MEPSSNLLDKSKRGANILIKNLAKLNIALLIFLFIFTYITTPSTKVSKRSLSILDEFFGHKSIYNANFMTGWENNFPKFNPSDLSSANLHCAMSSRNAKISTLWYGDQNLGIENVGEITSSYDMFLKINIGENGLSNYSLATNSSFSESVIKSTQIALKIEGGYKNFICLDVVGANQQNSFPTFFWCSIYYEPKLSQLTIIESITKNNESKNYPSDNVTVTTGLCTGINPSLAR